MNCYSVYQEVSGSPIQILQQLLFIVCFPGLGIEVGYMIQVLHLSIFFVLVQYFSYIFLPRYQFK